MTTLIAWVHGGHHKPCIHPAFMDSVLKLQMADAGARIAGFVSEGGLYVTENRNHVVERFLDETDFERLLFVDTDMTFEPGDVYALLDAAGDGDLHPILGGLYFSKMNTNPPVDRWVPVWLERDDIGNVGPCSTVTEGEYHQLAVVGMGFTVIHRRVLEAMRSPDPWSWFAHDTYTHPSGEKVKLGEDWSFCARAEAHGFSIEGFGVSVGHIKSTHVTWETAAAQYQPVG